MKKIISHGSFVLFLFMCLNIYGEDNLKSLKLINIELGYPVPAIPFYHFKAIVQLPNPSIIEVLVKINGQTLRSTDLYRSLDILEPQHPPLIQRPPSGYGLSEDATLYENPAIVGWIAWEPNKSYEIEIQIRMKKDVIASKSDKWLSVRTTLKGPEGPGRYNTKWKSYKSIVLSETEGVDRFSEPVEVVLGFYPDEVADLTREIRVVAVDPNDYSLSEVHSQTYDIMEYTKEDSLAIDDKGNPSREVPLWLPTITARVAFTADVKAKSSQVYLIYYNNSDALSKSYPSPLKVEGNLPGLHIENGILDIFLHPKSGHLDQIKLNSHPDIPFFHRLETNGAIHWNPEVYSPPRPWTHTSDWNPPPHIQMASGPVKSVVEMWGPLLDIPEVSSSVRYEFFPNRPYFISSTSLRINETIWTLALRNGEVVFKRDMMTHASWYDNIRGRVYTYDITDMPDLTDIKIDSDVPWITFYNKDTGIGFAGINLQYANGGLENSPRLLNPFMYITAGPWVYWARALTLPFLSSNMQQMVPALKGNHFMEKWAYLMYEIKEGSEEPYSPIVEWEKQLRHPLRIHLVEEVDNRVAKSVHEVLVGDGKSGWEGRNTNKRD